MNDRISASAYILLGMRMWALARPSGNNVDEYWEVVGSTLTDLETCGFPHTRQVARALSERKLSWHTSDKTITPQCASELRHTVQAVRNSLDAESIPRTTIALDTSGVSPQLRALSAWPLTSTQGLLLEETIRCLECGAHRSAMVMGWNLAYDYIRQWVFSNRLNDFNTFLTSNYITKSKGLPKFEPIAVYEDFFKKIAPSEGTVLESIRGAKIVGQAVYDHLSQYLRYRNDYAHSNFKSVTRDKANAYIEHLIDVISDAPFR